MRRKIVLTAVATAALLMLAAGPALAQDTHDSFNVSKNQNNPLAGAQIVFDAESGEVLWMTKGLKNRIARGLVDLETSEGFHGIIGAVDDTGFAGSTYIVTPEGRIPHQAQFNGSPDHGIVNVCAVLDC